MSSSTTVAAVVVGGPFVLTVAAIVIVPAMLARCSAAAAASSAISWASLLHVVPISVTSVLDYLSNVLVTAVLIRAEGEQLVLGRIALGFLGLSIVFAWVTLVGFWGTENWTAYGNNQQLTLRQLLLASLLAPLNLHVLYLGIVYSHTVGVADGDGDGAPQTPGAPKTPGSPSTRVLRSSNAGWYCMFVTLKLLEASLESVPLAVLIVAALVTGGSAGSMLLCASLAITCLSMSYGLYLQAMDHASDTSGVAQDAHKGQRRQIFVCVLVHLGWAVAATGCAMGTAALGVGRWLLPATLLLLGLLQALLAWRVQLAADHAAHHGGAGHEAGDPARARTDAFTTPEKGGVNSGHPRGHAHAGGRRAGSGAARRNVAEQLLRKLPVLSLASSVLDLAILLGGKGGGWEGGSQGSQGFALARDTEHRYKRLALFLARRLALAGCAAASLVFSWSASRATVLCLLLALDSLAASPRLCRHFHLGFLSPAGQDHRPEYAIRSLPDEVLLPVPYDGVDLAVLLLRLSTLPARRVLSTVLGLLLRWLSPLRGDASVRVEPLVEPKVEPLTAAAAARAAASATKRVDGATAAGAEPLRGERAWVRDALEPIIAGASAAARIHESNSRLSGALGALCAACDAAYARLEHAPQAEVLRMRTALLGYTPSEDGTAETALQASIESSMAGVVASGPSATPPVAPGVEPPIAAGSEPPIAAGSEPPIAAGSEPPIAAGSEPPIAAGSEPPIAAGSEPPIAAGSEPPIVSEHPVRGVPLAAALRVPLWVTVPSFFGRRVQGADWDSSRTVTRVDWFVSHSWRDGGARKVTMLRELCFLQAFVARLLIVGLLLVLLVGLCGLAVEDAAPRFPSWTLFAAAGTVLATLLGWVGLSVASVVPSRLAPWASSSTLLWIDKCCIDQSTPQTIKAGVDGFGRYLRCSEGMIAFVSRHYFSRIWCVYELASFCKLHQRAALHERLMLVALEWPSSLSPASSPTLTRSEREVLANFRCREAECFKPCDRATVLEAVRNDWGSEAAFDDFVQTELVKVLEESKSRYSTWLAQVASDTLELMFGS